MPGAMGVGYWWRAGRADREADALIRIFSDRSRVLVVGPNRRRFLSSSAGLAAGMALPEGLRATRGPAPLPAAPQQPDEAYWSLVRNQFPLRSNLVLLNAANLCPSPHGVQRAVFELTMDEDRDPSFHNRAKFAQLTESARARAAAHLGCQPHELAIVRNTSEGNNTVVAGLDLGRGDEVVIWDQNHPTNNLGWDVRAEREGFTVRRVSTPAASDTDQWSEFVEAFEAAFTPRTRVLSFSHVSNVTGVALPAEELCRLARTQGILTLVDGAQSCGALNIDLESLGCDFFTASTHKWLLGPKEAGLLFVRSDVQERLRAADVGVGWERAVEGGARKFENLGQRDDAAVAAVGTTFDLHEAVGAATVQNRVRALATALKQGIRQTAPRARFHTPRDESLSAGVVVVHLEGVDHRALYDALYRSHQIAAASMGGQFSGIRFSPHIYNTLADVERALSAFGRVLAT